MRLVCKEIFAPSASKSWIRWPKRIAICCSTLLFLLALGIWAISWGYIHFESSYESKKALTHIIVSQFGTSGLSLMHAKSSGESAEFLGAIRGVASVTFLSRVPKGGCWPPISVGQWPIQISRRCGPSEIHCGVGISEEFGKLLATTDELEYQITSPCWVSVLLFGAWPTVAFVRGPWRRAKRRAMGLCSRCGYNLTGLTESRCPECGLEFARESRVSS